ncbi:ester cyclase [Tistrella mobilis]|uniref:ester cyclase n=1 Tax=Tistrella mobilis TaxID=171437 RepID=UPI003557BA8E
MDIARIPPTEAAGLSPGRRLALEHFYGGLSTDEVDLVDLALTPDWQDIPQMPGQVPGPRGIKPIFRMLREAIPDLAVEIHDVLAGPDRAAVRLTATGTHLGPLFGVPAGGRRISFAMHEFHRFEGERIAVTHHMEDLFGLFRQIGAWPLMEGAAA